MSVQLESFLLKSGLMAPSDLESCLEEAARENRTLWDQLIKSNRISEDALADTFARWFNLPRIRIASATIEPEAVRKIDDKLARRNLCLPVKLDGKSLLLALANPLDYPAIQDVEFASGLNVRPLVTTRTEILDGIETHYAAEDRVGDFLANVSETGELRLVPPAREEVDEAAASAVSAAEVPPVVKMCNLIMQDAIRMQASDVHLEPGLNDMQVRFRVDGVLRDYSQVPKWLHLPLVSRLKILSRLDIAERRLPQDGRIGVQYQGRPIDVRVSTLPTHFGEKVVMRILGTMSIPAFDQLGLSGGQSKVIESALGQPQGMILVTGPTGSGKSTTLYSMVQARKSGELNIVTVEDPIEYQLPGVSQVQVNAKAGLTFASSLRSILRQDPDIILVGEIRDAETAEIAFQAAVTGHLVLSTLHTNSSLATIVRLLELGIDPFLITSSINVIVAQRLARRVCPRCKETYVPDEDVMERLRVESGAVVFHRGRGCSMCSNTGYAGRVGIFEVLRITPKLKELIHQKASEADMKAVAAAAGTRFLLDEALRRVILGQTTAEEVLRVVRLEEERGDLNTCPKCLSPIESGFSTCPYCLYSLKTICQRCGQELKSDWKACPYCHTRVQAARVTPPALEAARWTEAAANAAAAAAREVIGPAGPLRRGLPPALPGEAVLAGEFRTAGAPRSDKRLRVLAADDDLEMQRMIREALAELPHEMDVTSVGDGEAALRAANESIPDLVILDLKMPGVDGFTVCQRLRESVRTAFVPIMMLTASADELSRTTGFLLGTDDYVTKPFSVTDLNARVSRLLRRTYGL